MAKSRITITIPEALVRAADGRAKALERSRSWVVVDALRRYLGEAEAASGLGPYRQTQLETDLQLSVGPRVAEAERTARVAEVRRYDTRLAEVCASLRRCNASYVLVGAAAMQLWGSSRATRDIDILIEATIENAERVLAALGELGYGLATEWRPEEIASKPVTIIGDVPRVDVLTVAWSVRFEEAMEDAAIFELEGIQIPTASIEHLIASKRTGRLQDAADIEVLEEIRRLLAARREGPEV